MNSGFVNGFSVNGAAYPNWVIRAVVTAVAVASFAVAPTRITYASALGDAAVSVTLTQTHTIQARATATASASVDVQPTLIYAGNSVAYATATGNGAVRRDVFASAGGDATCYGEALTAQAIGEASTTMAATVVLANAHIVFPGRALTPCTATGTVNGDVTRYPTVLAGYGEIVYARAEPSIKRSGNSYFDHDGYGAGLGSATGEIPQDRVKIIATIGSFDFADSDGTSRAFVKYTARALGTGVTTSNSVVATHIYKPHADAQAGATASAAGTRNVFGDCAATAQADSYATKARIKYASAASGQASGTHAALGVRMAMPTSTASAGATHDALSYGSQVFAGATGLMTQATASASALQEFSVNAMADAVSVAAMPIYGTQHFMAASGNALSTAAMPSALINYAATAEATADAVLLGSTYGTQHRADSYAQATAIANESSASLVYFADTSPTIEVLVGNSNGWINGSNSSYTQIIRSPVQMATALVGKAYAIANSDTLAPDDRYMVVQQEDRTLTVSFEERTMVVTA